MIIQWGITSNHALNAGSSITQVLSLPRSFALLPYIAVATSNQPNQHIVNISTIAVSTIEIFSANIAGSAKHSNIRNYYIVIGR